MTTPLSEPVADTTLEGGEALAKAASYALTAAPEQRAIEFENRWYTFGDLGRIADQVGELIRRSGAEPQAAVAFAPRNRPSAIAALIGMIAAARTVRMMYVYQTDEALTRNFKQTNASIMVADIQDFGPELIEQLRQDGSVGIGLDDSGVRFVGDLERVTRPCDPGVPTTPTFEMLTSGTTGPAKLWPLTYELLEQRFVRGNSVFGAAALAAAPPTLLCYPLCNVSGLYTAVPAMISGMPIVLHDRFSLDGWLAYVQRYKPPELHLPPVGIQMLLDADVPREALGNPTHCRSGMTSLPVELHRAFEDRYGIPILLSYGATEFGGVVVQMTFDDVAKWGQAKLGSTGRAFGEAQVRAVDADTGAVLPAGQEGLLEVLVPSIKSGWTRTSDIVRIDEDGFVFILGRADGAITRGGFKILPETVEAALIQHPDIEAAAVVGVADRRLGQVPAALVEMRPGRPSLAVEELEQHVRRHAPATHVPVLWRFVDEIPRTASLKISRARVKELLAEEGVP